MRTKLFVAASLLIILSFVLGACAAPAAPTAPPPEKVVETVVQTVEVVKEGQTVVVTATPPPPAPAMEFKSKDATTYTTATFGDPETLDPALDYETAGGSIVFNVYETLIFYNRENPTEFVPQLAEEVPSVDNGGISADGKTYTFKIRKGVKFQDGTDLTPDDVAYTLQRGLLQGGTSSPQWLLTEPFLGAGTSDIAELVADGAYVDDPAGLATADPAQLEEVCKKVTDAIVADPAANTVTLNLAQSWGPLLATLANNWGAVQSKAWVMAGGGWDGDCKTWQNFYGKTSDQLGETPLGTTAMGSGPFKLDHWTPGEEIVLTANENYWRTEPAWEGGPTGAPALKKVIIKNVTEFSTRFAMFEAGDTDNLVVGSQADYPQADTLVGLECQKTTDDCKEIDANKSVAVIKGLQSISRTDMFFTFDINTQGGNNLIGSGVLDGNGIPPDFFSDAHIRKAFAYCFNYDTLLQDVMLGEGVRSTTVFLPGMLGDNPNAPYYTYDPAKCTEEFKASTLTSADGKSLWDTGFRMTVAYNTGNTQRQTMAQILQTELAAVNENFVIEVTGLPWPTFLKNQRASNLPIFISGWLEDIHDPHNWIVPYTYGTYGGRQKLPDDIKAKFQDYATRGVTAPTPEARQAIYDEFNQFWFDTASCIPMFVATGRRYNQRWVQGWYSNPIYPGTYYYPISKQ
jgi:peptide/nickel transport system substrate-binding protein